MTKKRNIRVRHPGLSTDAVRYQVEATPLKDEKPAVGVALKAALERR